MKYHIKNGRIIDPSRSLDQAGDLFVNDRQVVEHHPGEGTTEIDANGLWVVPGLIDCHVHLREPGQTHKETIETGLAAAAAGGFTAVLPMPNTTPTIDTAELTRWLIGRADELGGTRIYPVPAITIGREGSSLTPMAELMDAGAVSFTDDGCGVANREVMRQALVAAGKLGVTLCQHSEDPGINRGGVVHEGAISRELGLTGWPIAAEDRMVERDIELLRQVGGRLHVSHISSAGAVALVRKAKEDGLDVTAEVAPHHLHLTDEILRQGSTNAKVNPPLRPRENVDACRYGLAEGTIDIIATDHAPHTGQDKAGGFEKAAFGMVGLEISVGTTLALVDEGALSPLRMIEAMSTRPAKIFGLPGGSLAAGQVADITIINPKLSHDISSENFLSMGKNTPFEGQRVPGRAVMTIVSGREVFRLGD